MPTIFTTVMDKEAWHAAVHRVAKSRTRLSDWTKLNWALASLYLYSQCGISFRQHEGRPCFFIPSVLYLNNLDHLHLIWLLLWLCLGFPGGSEVKASACNAGDMGLIPGLGRSPGEGNGNPLQYSCLENPMDRGVWWATVWATSLSLSCESRGKSLSGSVLVRILPMNWMSTDDNVMNLQWTWNQIGVVPETYILNNFGIIISFVYLFSCARS